MPKRSPYAGPTPGVESGAVTTTKPNLVGTRITQARERAGLSNRELAKRCGIRRRLLLKWEAGVQAPTPASLQKLIPHIGGTLDHYYSPNPDDDRH